MLHYYRRTNSGLLDHSTSTALREDVVIDSDTITQLVSWPTAAMCAELDGDGRPSGWYVGTDADGAVEEG